MNYSYVTLLTDDTYVYGVVLLVESMKQQNIKYPLHVLVTDDVSAPSLVFLTQLGVTYSLVNKMAIPDEIHEYNTSINPKTAGIWRYCYTKFHIFNQTQFDKIVFLDADIMLLKNIDHLFDCPHMTAALDGEYYNIWPSWPHFNSGCIVIEPSNQLYHNILEFASGYRDKPGYIVADQEILNFYFKDWAEQTELHLNKYYNIFAPYINPKDEEDINENCYFIHFIGRKPWNFWLRRNDEQYSEKYYLDAKKLIENKLPELNWVEIRKTVKVTVYGICKNEIKFIDRWLKSFKEADYVCVLDTGSTDGTWEYLKNIKKKQKNLIIEQKEITPWRFDTARNESMKLIPKDTTLMFMADIDEIIKDKGWSDKVRNSWDPLFDRGTYKYHRDVGANGEILRTIPEYRIHSKAWYKWVNIVHEALIDRTGKKTFYLDTCNPIDIEVWHLPEKNKKTNYMELCEKDLEENPDDHIMRLQLAIEYEIREKYDKAIEHFTILINKPNTLRDFELARCYAGIGRISALNKNNLKALNYYREGRLLYPTCADNYLGAAEIYYNTNNFKQAIELCEEALKLCTNAEWCSYYDINAFYAYWILGNAYFAIDDNIKALGYLECASKKNSIEEISNRKQAVFQKIIERKEQK